MNQGESRFSVSLVLVALLASAISCATPAPREPVLVADPAPPADTDNTANPAPASAATSGSTLPATSDPVSARRPAAGTAGPVSAPRDTARALALVEEGRKAQREQGESGAPAARALYEQALALDDACAAAYWELGWSLQVLGEWDAAVATWDKLRKLAPDYPELSQHYPVLLMRRDNAAALARLPDPGKMPAPEEQPRPGPHITITAVGDVQMGTAWPPETAQLPPDNGGALFVNVASILGRAELMFGNLETVLADEGESQKCGKRAGKTCYAFRAPTAFAKKLKEVGFDVMGNANNHAGDYGAAARSSTLTALDGAGIKHAGPIGDTASWVQNGLKVGLVAFATGGDMYRVQEIETARRVVADMARKHDLVIVSFHAGAEGSGATHVPKSKELFYGEDRGNVHKFAHAMVDAGADLLLGHGPHVLRAFEIYHGRLIAYSLGNFCAWHGFSLSGALGQSGVLEVELAQNGVATAATFTPLVIDQPGVPRPDPDGAALRAIRTLSQADFGTSVFDASGHYLRPSSDAVATP